MEQDQNSTLLPNRHIIHIAAHITFIFFWYINLLKLLCKVLSFKLVNVYILSAASKLYSSSYQRERELAIHVYVPQYRIIEVIRSEERKQVKKVIKAQRIKLGENILSQFWLSIS